MEQVVVLLRVLLRRALNQHGSEPPALTDITIERARGRFGPRLGAQFANGHHEWTALTAFDCYEFCERHSAWDLESLRRALVREAHQIYTQIFEDHIFELSLRHRRERLEKLRRNAVSAPLIDQLRRMTHELEQQIQRHYRSRPVDEIQAMTSSPSRHRDPPPRLRDWWAQRRTRFPRMVTPRQHAIDYPPIDYTAIDAARARGLQLLEQNLSPTQRKQYDKHHYFDVVGGETGKHYRIRHGSQMNVDVLDKSGRAVSCLCFMPKGQLVVGDVMLAQKFALELFESEAIKLANKFSANSSMMRFRF